MLMRKADCCRFEITCGHGVNRAAHQAVSNSDAVTSMIGSVKELFLQQSPPVIPAFQFSMGRQRSWIWDA